MYICIDGIDGSGKSTLAQALATQLGYSYYETELNKDFGLDDAQFNKIRKNYFNSIKYNKSGILWFHCLKWFAFEHCIENKNAICVRSLASLYGYFGDNHDIFDLANNLFTKPDITILLKPNYHTTCSRLINRNSKSEIVSETMFNKFYDRCIQFLQDYHYKYVVLDNNGIGIEYTLSKALEVINHENI